MVIPYKLCACFARSWILGKSSSPKEEKQERGAAPTTAPSHVPHCLSQCVDNIRCNGLMMNAFEENSKVTVPQMIK